MERNKVFLKPNHSLRDWELFKKKQVCSFSDIQGLVPKFGRYTKEQVATHNRIEDCWCCLFGRVYDLSPFLDFHPGGVDILMKCAGKDMSALFRIIFLICREISFMGEFRNILGWLRSWHSRSQPSIINLHLRTHRRGW